MPIHASKTLWFNCKLVPWEQANVHVMTHALHYGSSIFEGIRSYSTPKGAAIFRLQPHIRRLYDSAKIYRMEIPYTPEDIAEACRSVIRDNELTDAYIRPLVWRGYGELGVNPLGSPVEVMVAAMRWGAYLGTEGLEKGVDVQVSSWNRTAPNTLPAMAKAGGNYLSSQLIVMEAVRHGYVEGIALDTNGQLSEGSGENLFVIRDNIIYTPPITAALLPGITRDAVMTIASDLGYELREQSMPREVLYLADEIFFTGTAAEVTPVRAVDQIVIGSGSRGPITAAIQSRFFGLFKGEVEDSRGWLDYLNIDVK